MFCVSCVSHAFASVHCCLVVTCWERADLMAQIGDVYFIFCHFPIGILGQVWYLNDCFLIFVVFLTLKARKISVFQHFSFNEQLKFYAQLS